MSVTERFRENASGIASILVTGIWMAAMFTDQSWWLPALLVGYIVVVPLVSILFDEEDAVGESQDDEPESLARVDESVDEPAAVGNRDALDTLRERYARGDLTDAQFERKLERLLETETVEDVEDRLREFERETNQE